MLNVLNSGELLKSHTGLFIPDSYYILERRYLLAQVKQYLIYIYKKQNFIHEVFQRSLKNFPNLKRYVNCKWKRIDVQIATL